MKEELDFGDSNFADDAVKTIADLKAKCQAQAKQIEKLEGQISRLGRLAFMGDAPPEKIIDHFIEWGDATFNDFQEMKAYIAKLEAAFLKLYVSDVCSAGMPRDRAVFHASEALAKLKESVSK